MVLISKITLFTDLIAWKKGHALVISIYQITNTFPKYELYSLGDQMRRSAISITSNIAEGFSRKTYKEKCSFIPLLLDHLPNYKINYSLQKMSFIYKKKNSKN